MFDTGLFIGEFFLNIIQATLLSNVQLSVADFIKTAAGDTLRQRLNTSVLTVYILRQTPHISCCEEIIYFKKLLNETTYPMSLSH